MHVVIAGSGRVGSELAGNLEKLGHTVALIDKKATAFEHLKPGFGGKKIVGLAFDREVLHAAGIEDAQAFASVTNGDNSNIVAARVAKEHYRVPHVVARIYDPRRAQIYQRLGIQTIASVRWTTDQIVRFLLPDDIPIEYTVDNGEVVLTAIQVPPEIVGKKLASLDSEGRRRVAAVSRFGVPRVPTEDMTVQDGDILYLSVARGEVNDLVEQLKAVGRPE